jgi:hypothetical protein
MDLFLIDNLYPYLIDFIIFFLKKCLVYIFCLSSNKKWANLPLNMSQIFNSIFKNKNK